MTITAERCVLVSHPWVHAFILTCDGKLAVWYKRRACGHRRRRRHGRPRHRRRHHRRHRRRGRHSRPCPRVPGVCCYYPATNRNFFNLALIWRGPGHFVRRFLHRRLPYRIIKPPCPAAGCGVQTACCASAVPTTLHLTLALDGSTVVLTWDGRTYWAGSGPVSCGDGVAWRLSCTGSDVGGLKLEFSCNGGTWQPSTQAVGGACDPLSVTYQVGLSPLFGCTNCGIQNFNATLTT
jgi:hypothetical protein